MQITKKNFLSPSIEVNWDIKKELKEKEYYKVISVSLFRKRQPYRDFKKYIHGLNELIKECLNKHPDYNIRIYHDKSVISLIDELQNKYINNYSLEYYCYDVPFFHEDCDSSYHKGTIGSIFRFLPLFENDIDECVVIDVDKRIKKIEFITNHMKINSISFSYNSTYFYSYLKRIQCIPDITEKYSIMANLIIRLNKNNSLPFSLFSDFLESYFIKKEFNWCKDCNIKNIYEYGVDEILINYIFLSYLKNKSSNVLVSMLLSSFLNTTWKESIYFINRLDGVKKILSNFLYTDFCSDPCLKVCNFFENLSQSEKENYKKYLSNEISDISDPVEKCFLKNFLNALSSDKNYINCINLKIEKGQILKEEKVKIFKFIK